MDKKKRRLAQVLVVLICGSMVLTTLFWALQLAV